MYIKKIENRIVRKIHIYRYLSPTHYEMDSFSLSVFQDLATSYHTNSTGKQILRNASLIDLIESLGAIFAGFHTTPETISPQAKYNEIVVSAFAKQDFFKFTSGLLHQFYPHWDSEFAFCTVNVPLGKFPRPSREEFQQFKHLYVLDQNMNLPISEVSSIEFIRAVRLYLMQLLFRFFKTYDVDETFAREGKTFQVCDPSKATFNSHGHAMTSEDFFSFLQCLIQANRYLKRFTLDLSEFVQPFRAAAQAAKADRAEYNAMRKAALAEYRGKSKTKAQSQPTQSSRQASLQKTFSVDARPFVPAPPPRVNSWKERKAKHDAAVAAAEAAVAEAAVAEVETVAAAATEAAEAAEAAETAVAAVAEVADTEGEFTLVAKKKRSNIPPKTRQRFRPNRT